MSKNRAFCPIGPTYVIPANTTAPAGVQVLKSTGISNATEAFRVVNTSTTETVYLAWSDTAAKATARAVIPTAGNPKNVLTIGPGTVETFWLPEEAFFSGITSTALANVHIVPGKGV